MLEFLLESSVLLSKRMEEQNESVTIGVKDAFLKILTDNLLGVFLRLFLFRFPEERPFSIKNFVDKAIQLNRVCKRLHVLILVDLRRDKSIL